MPQDGHWLANFEVIPLPPKSSFFRGPKNENSPLKTGCARTLLKKNLRPIFFFFFFGCFCRQFCLADVDSREQQAILLKKVGKIRPKFRFFLFFRRNI
jgi:hypothetical protein